MHAKDQLMFRILLNKFHPKTADAFFKSVPPALAKQVALQEVTTAEPAHLVPKAYAWIEKVHYSWLLNAFEKVPSGLKPSLLTILPEAHAKGISEAFKLPVEKINLSAPFKRFLINYFYSLFEKKEILPLEFIPENPLTHLTTLKKPMLVAMIDYLGLYDLAEEMRHIVEKNLLTNLYAALSPKKLHFLKMAGNQKEKLATPRLELEGWDKKKESLEKILHKRGLIRLSHALAGAHPDFVWHVVHILDSGRGRIITAYYKPALNSAASAIITTQIINVLNFLKKSSL